MNFPSTPSLNALGYNKRDRVVVFHAGDLGMCQATVSAYQNLHEAVLSAAVMMPCAWAPAAAQVIRALPTGADVRLRHLQRCG